MQATLTTAPRRSSRSRFMLAVLGSQFRRDRSVYRGPAQQPLWAHRFALSGDTITILGRQ